MERMSRVLKGYSTKRDGSMYLSADGFSMENIKNRKRFFTVRRLNDKNIIAANLVHGTRVEIVDESSKGFILNTDALVTKEQGIVLTLTGADCFPVYFEEKNVGLIGLAHCGWRGIMGGIITETLQVFRNLGAQDVDIFVTIGPGICKEHFEIQEKDADVFSEFPQAIIRGKKLSVNLKKIIISQLKQGGILRRHITDQKECTYCLSEKYFSYRRDKPRDLETQVAYIVR